MTEAMHNTVQHRFFDLITEKSPLNCVQNNPIQTYRELIHYRFKEVLSSTFPRFTSLLDEELFNRLIIQFIQSPAKTPFIWQMPNEFRQFLSQTDLTASFPFMEDLLWFEWIEVALIMQEMHPVDQPEFHWERPYRISDSAAVRQLHYPVFTEDKYDNHGAYAVMVYFDFDKREIRFEEITPFMAQFLQHLDNKLPEESLQTMALEYDIDTQELKNLLNESLQRYCTLSVLAPGNDL